MSETWQKWSLKLVLERGSYDNYTTPGPTHTPRGFSINPRLDVVAIRAPSGSGKDSHSQAILKQHNFSSLNYRAHHGLPVILTQYSTNNNGTGTHMVSTYLMMEINGMSVVLDR